MDDPESWRWIWLATAVAFGIGEMHTPGAFFLGPFALGAAVASALAFADVPIAGEWAAFLGVAVAAFAGLRPLARRLGREGGTDGVGSRRLIGRPGTVLEGIEPGHVGLVRIDREEWRAQAADRSAIPSGAHVRVTHVEGTRVIVIPTEEDPP